MSSGGPGEHDDRVRSPPTRTEYLLAELRCASLRARLQLADIDAVGLALANGLIEAEQAIELLRDCNCLEFIQPTEPEL